MELIPMGVAAPAPAVAGRRGHPACPPRILAVQTQRIGDAICFTPLLTALRRRFPGARLAALVQPPADELLAANADLDALFVYDPVRDRHPFAVAGLARRLRRERFEWAFVVHAASSVSWAIRLAGIPWRTCVWRYGAADPPPWVRLYNQGIRQERGRGERHEVDYNLDALRALGIEPQHGGLWVAIRPEAEQNAQRRLRWLGLGEGARFAVLHPGHAGGRQEWPPEHFARLADRLLTELRLPLVLTGSRREAPLCQRVAEEMARPPFVLAGQLALPELAAVIRAASLYVSVPTGPMHLAAALGTPVVCLFGPDEVAADRVRFCPYVGEQGSQGARGQGSKGAREQGCRGVGEWGSATESAREQGSRGAGEQGRVGEGGHDPRGGYAAVVSPARCDCRRMRDCRNPVCMRAITPEMVFSAARQLLEQHTPITRCRGYPPHPHHPLSRVPATPPYSALRERS
jgi:ADP-heptose:LPS heptosyltransferase